MKKKVRVWCMLAATLICMAFSQKVSASTVNESEDNDSVAVADIINNGDSVSGSIAEDDGKDIFKITLPAASMVQLDMTAWMSHYSILVYDAAGKQVWGSTGNEWNSVAGYGQNIHKMYLEKGVYYIEINGYYFGTWGGKANGQYSFVCSIKDMLRNNREPDNVFAQANEVRMGELLKGQISNNDDLDLWTFRLDASGRIRLEITSYMPFYSLRLYGTDGTEYWAVGGNSWNEDAGYRRDTYSVDLEAGNYYLEVNGYEFRTWGSMGTGTYDIATSYEASGATNVEPDNSFANANALVLGTTYRGQSAANDEFDTYRFSAPASGRIQIDMTSWMPYYTIFLFDVDGNKVWSQGGNPWNENVGYRTDKIIVELEPGTYYMQINGYEFQEWGYRATGVYQFKVSAKGASRVSYVLKGGKNGSNPTIINGKGAPLKDAKRKGYYFGGWYTDSKFQNRIYNLPEKSDDDITLYAKWDKVKVDKPKIYSAYNIRGRKIYLSYGDSSYAEGYEITYAYNKKLTKGKKVIRTKKTTRTLKKLKKRRTIYIRLRAFKYDSARRRVYSKYSGCKKVKIRY